MSCGCRTTGFREDTTFATGRVQAANDVVLRFGIDTITGFAVGGLWPRFKPKRVSFAPTALRLHPRRPAICEALCPEAQSFFNTAKSSAAQLMTEVIISRLSPARQHAVVDEADVPFWCAIDHASAIFANTRRMRSGSR